MNIYFAGMIGSGKTTLGLGVARELGLPFFDLDQEMERILGYSFHKLVAEQGWVPFRELEYSICKSFAAKQGAVCCLGGGTVRYEWNTDVLSGTGVTVLLEVSPEELVRRVRLNDRPRVNPGTTLEEDVTRMWRESKQKYYAAADLIYTAEGKTPETEVQELVTLLKAQPGLESLR